MANVWTDDEVKAQVLQVRHRLKCEYCVKNYPKMCKEAEEIVKPKSKAE